jgi:2-oxoglutarate ferredoxin oxidoreductase subunit delta
MPRIVIDEDRCKGCGLCTLPCPFDLVHMADHFNAKGYRPSTQIDPQQQCTGCTLCAMVCPDVAITVYREQRAPAPAALPDGAEPSRPAIRQKE